MIDGESHEVIATVQSFNSAFAETRRLQEQIVSLEFRILGIAIDSLENAERLKSEAETEIGKAITQSFINLFTGLRKRYYC